MNRITGVYVYRVDFTRGGHTFIFRYHHRATLIRHIAYLRSINGISIPDAGKVLDRAMKLEWQTKGV